MSQGKILGLVPDMALEESEAKLPDTKNMASGPPENLSTKPRTKRRTRYCRAAYSISSYHDDPVLLPLSSVWYFGYAYVDANNHWNVDEVGALTDASKIYPWTSSYLVPMQLVVSREIRGLKKLLLTKQLYLFKEGLVPQYKVACRHARKVVKKDFFIVLNFYLEKSPECRVTPYLSHVLSKIEGDFSDQPSSLPVSVIERVKCIIVVCMLLCADNLNIPDHTENAEYIRKVLKAMETDVMGILIKPGWIPQISLWITKEESARLIQRLLIDTIGFSEMLKERYKSKDGSWQFRDIEGTCIRQMDQYGRWTKL